MSQDVSLLDTWTQEFGGMSCGNPSFFKIINIYIYIYMYMHS